MMISSDKFKPLYEEQPMLFGLTREDYLSYLWTRIPSSDLCRLVKEIVFHLDTSSIESNYSTQGQKSYHPKLLLSLLFYGYAIGIRSSRQLESKCHRDMYFYFLMDGYTPDHRTISDFRKDYLLELESHFVEILEIFDRLEIAKVGKIYLDGVKVRANGSSKRTKDVEGFEKWRKRLALEVEEILGEASKIDRVEDDEAGAMESEKQFLKSLCQKEQLQGKIKEIIHELESESQSRTRLNLTDKDSAHMKSGGSRDIRPSYNCQAAVTEDGLITTSEVTQDCNDRN
jgi:transposase